MPIKKGQRFDYLFKLFQQEMRGPLKDYADGSLAAPLIIEFDPTTACNYQCPECISANLLNQDHIPGDRIKTLFEEFHRAGVKAIILIGGGEPLAHSAMPRPITQAAELGIAVGLVTNGSLISRHMEVLGRDVSWTRVSMDAATSQTYNLFRPNRIKDSFSKVVHSMEQLARVKSGVLGYSFLVIQRPDTTPSMSRSESNDMVSIRSLLRNDPDRVRYVSNATEIYAAARLAKEIGCDYFEYKPMVEQEQHYLLAFDESMRSIIRDQHLKCKELEDATFEIIAPQSIEYLCKTDNPVQPKYYGQCPSMELRTLVTPSGIYPCPYFRGRSDKRLGTVFDGPFDVWWNSDERRAAAANIDPRKDCQFYCIRHQSNIVLHHIKAMHQNGVPILDHLKTYDDIGDQFF